MEEFLVSSIKRLYDESHRALEQGEETRRGESIIDRYNELLEEVKKNHPDNSRIQELKPASKTGWNGRVHPNDVQNVKFGLTTIADSAGLDLEDFKDVGGESEMQIIKIENNQSQSQNQRQEQYVKIEEIYEDVDRAMAPKEKKETVKEYIKEFKNELESESPDKNRMIEIISFVRDTSTQVASKLGIMALQRGIDIIGSM